MPLRNVFISGLAMARRAAHSYPASRALLQALAVRVAKFRWGARLIKSVTEPLMISDAAYRQWWSRYGALTDTDRARIAADISRSTPKVMLSVVVPVYNPHLGHLEAAIESVRGQLYPNWELCLVDDASEDGEVWRFLEETAQKDPRIRVARRPKNGNISAASNDAMALSRGAYLAFMDQDDLLHEAALYAIVAAIEQNRDAVLLYTDEDKIDGSGHHSEPYFKPDWDPELILSQNMVNHLCVLRRDVVQQVGGFRIGLEGAQDLDLVLRVSAAIRPEQIIHIPKVLYHWRQRGLQQSFSETQIQRCRDAAERACNDHLAAVGDTLAHARAKPDAPGWLDVIRRPPTPAPRVSIIIPTRDRAQLLSACVDSLTTSTPYTNYEVIIADNDSVEPVTLSLFEALSRRRNVTLVKTPGPFNFSAINNQAAAVATGEILLFLNNDITVETHSWLDAIVAQVTRPQVGAVGAKLIYPDGRIQHAGICLGVGADHQIAKNTYSGAPGDFCGYANTLRTARSVSAVTAACLAVRKDVFTSVGGFDAANLPVAFNDVDLCLRIKARGLQIIWTPHATLTHHESASRGADTDAENRRRFDREAEWMRRRWGEQLNCDPYYGPNFDRVIGDYQLADPPRQGGAWVALRADERQSPVKAGLKNAELS